MYVNYVHVNCLNFFLFVIYLNVSDIVNSIVLYLKSFLKFLESNSLYVSELS